MVRSLVRSQAHFKKALARLPLGVASNFRYWGDDRTIYVARGKGGRIFDIDGNGYVDYRLGYGPAILGYADPRIDEAAQRGMAVGGVFALSTPGELAVAERIAAMVPAAELVQFSNSGTEAVMAGLRLARAVTGKESYVLIEGSYHGLFDGALWVKDLANWDPRSNSEPATVPYSQGVPRRTGELVHLTPMNDAQRLEDLLKRHHGSIAALLIEPIMGNCCGITATRAFLAAARSLCSRYEVLLFIDEVKSGFRVARGGVQELYGVAADLCTFAKAMANGYPIAAVAGHEEVMRRFGRGVAHGGTYTAHSVSLAAAEACLGILEETDALDTVAACGERLMEGMGAILDGHGIVHSFAGHAAMFGLFFAPSPPADYRAWKRSDYRFYDALARELHELGVLCEPDSREPWFLCEAHARDNCIEDTLEAFERAVDLTLRRVEPNRFHAIAAE